MEFVSISEKIDFSMPFMRVATGLAGKINSRRYEHNEWDGFDQRSKMQIQTCSRDGTIKRKDMTMSDGFVWCMKNLW